MSSVFFHAVECGEPVIGDGSAAALVAWLQDYVQALFPQNSIEYWSTHEWSTGPTELKSGDPVPVYGSGEDPFISAGCWANNGVSEGREIQLYLVRKSRALERLAWIKTFDTEEISWQIAHALQCALESYLRFRELPSLVELFRTLPDSLKDPYRESPATVRFRLEASPTGFRLVDSNEHLYFSKALKGPSGALQARAYLEDCRSLLNRLKLTYTQVIAPCFEESQGSLV